MSSSPTEATRLTPDQVRQALSGLAMEWILDESGNQIHRVFEFKGFYKTMAFVNAVAWIAQKENHHPDMEVSYNRCVVRYTTHDAGGLTGRDFECARLIEALF